MTNTFPITPSKYRDFASKAVSCFVKKQYSKFFSVEDIEDMTSEVTLRMWRARDSFDPSKGDFFHWVWTIAKNVVLSSALSKHNREDISGSFEDGEVKDDTSYSIFRGFEFGADKEVLLEEAEASLFSKLRSERDRKLLRWKLEGFEPQEIAKMTGLSVPAVYVAFYHLRQRLSAAA